MTTDEAFNLVKSSYVDREKIKQLASSGVKKAHQKLACYVDFIANTIGEPCRHD